MAKGDVRNSKRFRELAAMLREQAELRDVSLVGGEAEELLGAHLSALANQLGITERTTLTSYISEQSIESLAARFAAMKAEYRGMTEEVEPVTLEAAEAGHVVAALGMAVKLAVEHVEETRMASLGLITDAADAIVRLGAQLRTIAPLGQVEFGGHELVLARSILVGTIERLRAREWQCSCDPHPAGEACNLITSLDYDLRLIGGWVPDEPA
jgi:hypothetical protein